MGPDRVVLLHLISANATCCWAWRSHPGAFRKEEFQNLDFQIACDSPLVDSAPILKSKPFQLLWVFCRSQFTRHLWSSGYDVSLTRWRSPVRSWPGVLYCLQWCCEWESFEDETNGIVRGEQPKVSTRDSSNESVKLIWRSPVRPTFFDCIARDQWMHTFSAERAKMDFAISVAPHETSSCGQGCNRRHKGSST